MRKIYALEAADADDEPVLIKRAERRSRVPQSYLQVLPRSPVAQAPRNPAPVASQCMSVAVVAPHKGHLLTSNPATASPLLVPPPAAAFAYAGPALGAASAPLLSAPTPAALCLPQASTGFASTRHITATPLPHVGTAVASVSAVHSSVAAAALGEDVTEDAGSAVAIEQSRFASKLREEVAAARNSPASSANAKLSGFRFRPSVATWNCSRNRRRQRPIDVRIPDKKKRRVRFVADGAPDGAATEYYTEDSLRVALEVGGVRLLKGKWLAACHSDGRTVLPRCQDLPEEAFWRPEEKPWQHRLVSISYCWVNPDHPDPDGEQFEKILGPMMTKLVAAHEHVAVFWDWCSIPQQPRSAEDNAAYKRALEHVHLWYAHTWTAVWMLTKPPEGVKAYSERGWPSFERAVSSLIMPVSRVLDLGLLSDVVWQNDDYAEVEWKCKVKQLPPESPERFAGTLKGRRFSNKADRDIVAKKYEETFQKLMGTAQSLEFKKLGWDDDSVLELCSCLPLCGQLRRLKLRDNRLMDLVAVSDWLAKEGAASLQTLDLSKNRIADLTPLRPALTVHGSALDYLSLWDNAIVDVTPLGEALADGSTLRELHLDRNQVADIIPLGAALACNHMLRQLNLRNNRIADVSALGRGLANNSALQTLNLDDNLVSDVAVLAAGLATNTGLESLSLKTNHIVDVTPLGHCLSTNSTLDDLDVRGNPVVAGVKELRSAWLKAGRCQWQLLGCDALEDVVVPQAKDCTNQCSYTDTLGYENTWSLVASANELDATPALIWCSDGEDAPSFSYVSFYPQGSDGINYVSTEDWVSTLPRAEIPTILAKLRHMADAALIKHNICDEMTISGPVDDEEERTPVLREVEEV